MHPNIGRSMLGGFVGTLVMTAMMYGVTPMMGLKMDIARMLYGSILGAIGGPAEAGQPVTA